MRWGYLNFFKHLYTPATHRQNVSMKQENVNMASWLIATIGVVYLVVAADLLIKGQTGLGIAFLGYALGNVGLYMEAA